ncbi:MAG: TolC family protein [Xanthomonadaceae bacterium]|nr:TolC family protein [Xanthomonadaceae bacterium]MDE1960249.1 TolC family protein [Xanthomonadaceae bacterium]MDE2084901.1 TolC family protein [Xanthomonadaceae bacterium]MDE2257924.1 TolC family protein [Xanthomonadaceae bacterium]
MAADPHRHRSAVAGGGVWLLAVLALGGCAIYRPRPLEENPKPADAAGLAQTAAAIKQPRLAPLPIPPQGPWNDLQLADIAIVASPDLQALRAQAQVADAQVFAAGLLPDPQIGIGADAPDGSGVVPALSLSAGFDIAALFTRHSRVAAARASAERVRRDIAWQEWLAANQVRLLARRWQFLERQHDIAARAADAAEKLLSLTQTAVAQHNARLDDLALRRVAVLDARAREGALARDAEAARLQLNLAVGVAPDVRLPLTEVAAPHDPSALDATALEKQALAQRLDLAALRAGYAAQEASVRSAILQQYPLPAISVSRARDTTPVYTKGASANFSLPLWNRNRGGIAIARATREQLHAEYAARVFDAQASIAAQVEALKQTAAQRQTLDAQLDQLRAEMQPLEKAAERGDVALVTFETARAALLDKEIASLALAQAQSEDEVALAIDVGALIWK